MHENGGEDHASSVGKEQWDVAELSSVETEKHTDHVHDSDDEAQAEFSTTDSFFICDNFKSEFSESLEGVRVDKSFPEHEPIANEDVTKALHKEQVQWALEEVLGIHIFIDEGQNL